MHGDSINTSSLKKILWFSLSFFLSSACAPVSMPIILTGSFHCPLHFKPTTKRKKLVSTVRKLSYFVCGSR